MRVALTALMVFVAAIAYADQAPAPAAKATYSIVKIDQPVKVDGVLDETEWRGVTPIELAWETNPGDNVAPPVKTEGYLAYDDRQLYVGFRAHDPNPVQIRANLSDRDKAYQDDFLGVVLDTFNDERRAFEFFVNPLGVQMDLTNNDVGGNEDDSWDAIWSSAGKIHSDRYEVEMAIPFSQLRFRSSDGEQTWGLDLVRIYPRDKRHRIGSNRLDKNRNCYICQFSKLTGFVGISPGRNVELDPTVTSHRTDARASFPNTPLKGGDFETEPGLTAKWGVTPNVTLNAAINPDFSQVEADSVQLDINTTFALFFNEKRPLFLEGADFFETPFTAVYTRTIASPDWGLKVTGKRDKSGGGLFVAHDSTTNLLLPGSQGSALASIDDRNLAAVLRYRYDVGKNSTVGLLFTNRSGGDYANHVGGVDGFFRLNPRNSISAQVLTSSTKYPNEIVDEFEQPSGTFGDQAVRFRYRHESRNWFWKAEYETVGTNFRADSGFMPQVDYWRPAAGLQRSFWGNKNTWWSRIWWGGDWDRTVEQSGQVLEDEYETWFQIQGPKQSFVSFDGGFRDRFFNGREFNDQKFLNFFAEFTPLKALYAFLELNARDAIDFANTRPGKELVVTPFVRYRVTRNLELSTSHTFQRLNVEGGRLFTANVTEGRAVYQFNLRTFARLLMQYTDIKRNSELYNNRSISERSKRLFPQLLFSYKINPQTVLFVGYSSTRLADEHVVDLTENDRTLFVKIGYAWAL